MDFLAVLIMDILEFDGKFRNDGCFYNYTVNILSAVICLKERREKVKKRLRSVTGVHHAGKTRKSFEFMGGSRHFCGQKVTN